MREPSPLQIQSLAERYTVDRELGHGGMATVFLATERKHRRKVAIKMLHADIAASVGAERKGLLKEQRCRVSMTTWRTG